MPTLTPLRPGFGSSEQPTDFAHPPLIEVWLGLELASPSDFTMIEAAQWRNRLGPEWLGTWHLIGAAERHSPGTTLVERQLRRKDVASFEMEGHLVVRLAGLIEINFRRIVNDS